MRASGQISKQRYLPSASLRIAAKDKFPNLLTMACPNKEIKIQNFAKYKEENSQSKSVLIVSTLENDERGKCESHKSG